MMSTTIDTTKDNLLAALLAEYDGADQATLDYIDELVATAGAHRGTFHTRDAYLDADITATA